MNPESGKNDSRKRLYQLIELAKCRELSIKDFCEFYEKIYNLELDKNSLSPTESAAFSKLFDSVVWFSPYPKEREKIANYLGEEEIHAAIAVVDTELSKAVTR